MRRFSCHLTIRPVSLRRRWPGKRRRISSLRGRAGWGWDRIHTQTHNTIQYNTQYTIHTHIMHIMHTLHTYTHRHTDRAPIVAWSIHAGSNNQHVGSQSWRADERTSGDIHVDPSSG